MDTTTGNLGETVRTNSGDEDVSVTVVKAVADAKGVDPLDLDPLCDSIELDALDRIFDPAFAGSSVTELSFEVDGCEVLVRGSGEVVVTPATTATEGEVRVTSLD